MVIILEKIKDLFIINYYNTCSGTLQICILVHLVLYVDIILYMHIYLFVATFINIHNVCMY